MTADRRAEWPRGLFPLTGDTLHMHCASKGCGQRVSMRLEVHGIGSVYCIPCAERIAAFMDEPAAIRALKSNTGNAS